MIIIYKKLHLKYNNTKNNYGNEDESFVYNSVILRNEVKTWLMQATFNINIQMYKTLTPNVAIVDEN